MKKKIISAAIACAMLLSLGTAAAVPAEAAAEDYGLASSTADGVILHCFDWSYNAIRENLPEIAEAGYTTVQTSPVQQPKDFGEWLNGEGQWWKLYQPLSFTVATENSWIGTKDELIALCEEADKYGIKIICDIVSNHMANTDGKSYLTYAHDIKKYEPELYKNSEQYFHQLERGVSDDRLEWLVQGELDKLPDLNTGDEFVQSRVISLLEECIDCGVDGFRFDAAKHIETPADGEFASDFWPNVIGAANDYAAQKGTELFCYGEVLNSPGKGRSTLDYTQYINLVDNKAGDITLYNVAKKKPDKVLIGQQYSYEYDDPSHFIIWAESHDTYMGNSGTGGFGNTSGVSNEDIVKAWAIVASRAKSHALYFARPNELMGLAGDTTWKSMVVSEINRFHNKFIRTDDAIFADGDVVAVQRGDSGIVLVNLGESADVSVTTQGMKDGEYADSITGNTFTVSGGKISGTIGDSGVALVYEDASVTPKISFSSESTTFRRNTYKLTVSLQNADSGTYSVNGADPVSFTGEAEITIGDGIEEGTAIPVKVTATKGDKTVENTNTYTKEKIAHSGVYVYFDNSAGKYDNVYAYAFYDDINEYGFKYTVAKDGQWPGTKMEFDEEKGMYAYEVPADIPIGKGCVILNDAHGTETQAMVIPGKESIYSESQNKLIDPNGVTLVYGDLDSDGAITSNDSLATLRYSAGLAADLTEEQKAQADVDGDGDITSADALSILRKSNSMEDASSQVGQEFVFGGTNSGSDDSKKDDGTSDPVPSGNTFYVVNSAGWIFHDGCKIWIVNNATGEALEMTKSDPQDDNAKYCYIDLPVGWTDISLHRTQWNMTIEESEGDSAHKVWNVGTIPDGKNSYSITGNDTGRFKNYTP